MINDKKQEIKGGNNSSNFQAETIVQNGLSYRDAKEIALDVFKQNYLKLSKKAMKLATKRAEELIDKFLNEIKITNPASLISVQEPNMQNSLYSAQKSYVITGNSQIADLLVDLLVERAKQKEYDLEQIILDGSIEVISKITIDQLDILTLVFLIKYYQPIKYIDLEDFYKIYLEPFINSLTTDELCYQHLEYCGCGRLSSTVTRLETSLLNNYTGYFANESLRQFDFHGSKIDVDALLFTYNHKNERVPLAMNQKSLKHLCIKYDLPYELINRSFFMNLKGEIIIEDYLIEKFDRLSVLFDVWRGSSINRMTLTSVGIEVAKANFRRKNHRALDY